MYHEVVQQGPCKGRQVAREEAEGVAAGGEAARAPHSVDVGLHAGGEVIVDYVWQVPDVQASSSNVSCYQDLCRAILEGLQGCLHTRMCEAQVLPDGIANGAAPMVPLWCLM